MAHVLRLIAAALLLLVAGAAWASIPATSGTQYRYVVAQSTWFNSLAELASATAQSAWFCGSKPANWSSVTGCSVQSVNSSNNTFLLNKSGILSSNGQPTTSNDDPAFPRQAQTQQSSQICPANSAYGNGACQCNSGYGESGGACVANSTLECNALAGQSAGRKVWNGTGASFSFCDAYNSAGGGQCVVTATQDSRFEVPAGSGKWESQGEAVYTGGRATSCNGSGGTGSDPAASSPVGSDGQPPTEPAPNTAAPAPCPAGQAPGEVNGQRVCAPMGSDVKSVAPSPQTGSSTQTNADGTSTTTTTGGTTTCSGGQCTTTNSRTVVTRDAAGTVTGTTTTSDSSTQSQSSFCQANGKSLQCAGEGDGKGGSFSGDCAAGFKADGDDAVINAMALEVYRQNCKVNPDVDSQALAKAEAVKTGNQTGNNPNNSSVSIGSGNFDSSDAFGLGSTCPADRTITVNGQAVTWLPFSKLCGSLEMLGFVLMGVSFLLAARIVARG